MRRRPKEANAGDPLEMTLIADRIFRVASHSITINSQDSCGFLNPSGELSSAVRNNLHPFLPYDHPKRFSNRQQAFCRIVQVVQPIENARIRPFLDNMDSAAG
jgi:hypothetical protein